MNMVGAEGFEPPTLCSQSRCATKLRYAPTNQHLCCGAYDTLIFLSCQAHLQKYQKICYTAIFGMRVLHAFKLARPSFFTA